MRTEFKDLKIGDTFDWIDPYSKWGNSFYSQCVKVSDRNYKLADPGNAINARMRFTVGSIHAIVYHVNEDK